MMQRTAALGLALMLLSGAAPSDKDKATAGWPCEAVPEKLPSFSHYWPERNAEAIARNWRADSTNAALVAQIAPRSMSEDEAIARVRARAANAKDRQQAMAALVAGLVETISVERQAIITGIYRFNARQGHLAKRIEDGYQQSDQLPGKQQAGDQRADFQDQLDWDIRIFEDRQRMLPIICKQPAILEARLKTLSDAARQTAAAVAPPQAH